LVTIETLPENDPNSAIFLWHFLEFTPSPDKDTIDKLNRNFLRLFEQRTLGIHALMQGNVTIKRNLMICWASLAKNLAGAFQSA
jgi:hypothetical protein